MKNEFRITPVKNYKTPAYPRLEAVKNDRALLKALPSRWQRSAKALACLGIMGTFAVSSASCGMEQYSKSLGTPGESVENTSELCEVVLEGDIAYEVETETTAETSEFREVVLDGEIAYEIETETTAETSEFSEVVLAGYIIAETETSIQETTAEPTTEEPTTEEPLNLTGAVCAELTAAEPATEELMDLMTPGAPLAEVETEAAVNP